MLYLIWASFYTEFCPTTTSRAVVHSYLGEAGWALSHHPPALIESIPYAIYLGSSVPRSRILNVINKISLTGPTKVGEKEANFGLRMLSNTVACTPRVFMPKDAYAYSQFVSCLPFESSAVVIGNTRWTRSITGTAERFSLYPFRQPCHMTFHWSREGLRKCIGTARKEQNLINPRLGTRGRSKMWIYGMFEALEKSPNTSLYIGRRTVWFGSQKPGGIKLRGCDERKAPLHLNLVSIYWRFLCFAFLFPHIVFLNSSTSFHDAI